MRWVLILLAACGGSGAAPASGDGSGSAEAIKRLDLPRMDDSAQVTLLAKARPPALVWVDTHGRLAMKSVPKTWAGDITPPGDREPEDVDITTMVLDAVIDGPEQPHADTARQLLVERRTNRTRRQMLRTAPPRQDPSSPAMGRLEVTPAVTDFSVLDKLSPLVIATPSAPATAVVAVVRKVGGTLAVDHLGKLAVLDVAFVGYREPERVVGVVSWLEVSADSKGIVVRRFPDESESLVAWNGAGIDRGELGVTLKRLGDASLTQVDVVVTQDTTAQTLVDLLAALHSLKVKKLAVAEGPDSLDERKLWLERARRGLPGTTSALPGSPNTQGDLDKTAIRDTVRQQLPQIRLCYEKVLVTRPGLQGTLQAQFFIQPDGKVGAASAAGVDPDVASCVADVIKTLQFPKPDGGGGVQVQYPFTFRASS